MLPILQFMFSDFWHWFGSFLMLATISNGLGAVITYPIRIIKSSIPPK